MPTITTYRMAAALLAAAIAYPATAQESAGRSDMFGQNFADQEAAAPSVAAESAKRVRITNAGNGTPAEKMLREQQTANSESARNTGNVTTINAEDKTNEFQKFVFENTGETLPVFGADFFAASPTVFAPIVNAPVTTDYPLGPGDELIIRGWGSIDVDLRATIDRNGTINIPTVGAVSLAGVKAGDAEEVIRAAIGRLYRGVTVSVSLGQLRAITVYVVGQAKKPGTYTISSLSTLVTTLFATGGPNANGSMRAVQVKRAGKVVAELDLYAFLAKGDKSADIKLLDGDTVYIPAASGFVALVGKVNSPAIYELKSDNETIESILGFAGGLPVNADPRRAFLERVDPSRTQPRSVVQFSLDREGLQRKLKNGDLINITPITPDFSNAVVLRGNVSQAVRAPFKDGMRVRDLIPSRDYLITRSATQRQNDAVLAKENGEQAESIAARIGSLIDEVNWDYAVVERINRTDLSVSLIPFNLGKVFTDPESKENVLLQPGDTVTIFSHSDVEVPLEKRRVFVRVEGEVKIPGVYQMSAGDTLQTLLSRAGGPTSDAYLLGTAFYREKTRKEQEASLEKAAARLETQLRNEQARGISNIGALSVAEGQAILKQREEQAEIMKEHIARFRRLKPSGRIAFGIQTSERSFAQLPQIRLEHGDRLVIPAKPTFINVFGAVNSESSPLWRPNLRVADYLNMVGLTTDADVDNVFVMRVDGTVISKPVGRWSFGGIKGTEVLPGDTIIVPEKFDRETGWSKFTKGTREWAQILANFGLGAAAIKTLRTE